MTLLFATSTLGLTALTAPDADAAFIRRTKLKKKRIVGYRAVVVVGDGQSTADGTDPGTSVAAVAVHFPEDDFEGGNTFEFGPSFTDPDTGDLVFTYTLPADFASASDSESPSSNGPWFPALPLAGSEVGKSHAVIVTLLGADGAVLDTSNEVLTVAAATFPEARLEVLNTANDAGDIVVVAGDSVEVQFALRCDDPSDVADCEAQLALSHKADRIELIESDGSVISAKRRGKQTSGTVNLRTRRGGFNGRAAPGEGNRVVFVASVTGEPTEPGVGPITLVGSAFEAIVLERLAVLEAKVDQNSATIALHDAGTLGVGEVVTLEVFEARRQKLEADIIELEIAGRSQSR
jgi:hypothetical protein